MQVDMTCTLPEFLDTELDTKNALQNQPCVQKIVKRGQAALPGLSRGSYR